MSLAAALIYWVIIALWLAVLTAVSVAFFRNPRTFGTVRLLLAVLTIDTVRNLIENLYFGLYFGGQYGLFPAAIVGVLGNPNYLILPKVLNVFAACAVLVLLVYRWLPLASREKLEADEQMCVQAEALSRETVERRRFFETSLDLILITDVRGTFIQVSPSSLSTIGYRPEEMIGRRGDEFILPEDLKGVRQEMKMARRGHLTRNFETRYVHKSGCVISLAWSGVWSEPEEKHFFFGRDISEQKIAEEKLRYLAHYDQLCGLPNRVSLQNDFAKLIADNRPAALAILDLDGFKDINDTLGHSVGDRLLQEVAKRLEQASDDLKVYRLGGDEFVALSGSRDPLSAAALIDGLLTKLSESFEVNGHRLFIAASAGIAIAPSHGESFDEILANADLALYDAKAAGGRGYRLFVPTLRAKASSRLRLESELRKAWANNEFELHYQPQFRSGDLAITGAEALLRWRHPERGLLSPAAFIDVLKESAVVLQVGRWVLREACRKAASWRAEGRPQIRIGVNLFPAQVSRGGLLRDVEEALRESGLPAEALELEITENIALNNDETMKEILSDLRAQGIGIAFDDFGTGYASLTYLTRFPLTRIKIDRSFVQNIAADPSSQDTAIVRSTIMMAKNLNLQVTAEGVETDSQLAFLQAQNCNELQGYLFSKPLQIEEFEDFLTSYRGPDCQISSIAV